MMATDAWYHPEFPPFPSRQRPGSNWRRFVIATLGELPAVLDELEVEMRGAEVSLKVQFAIRLSLEEAVANAIRHGHRGNPALQVRICWCLTSQRWLGEVQDCGPGFDVYSVLPQALGTGHGIALMRRYLNWLRYNHLGNRVVLCKYLGPRAA